jgi:hypothetical protein
LPDGGLGKIMRKPDITLLNPAHTVIPERGTQWFRRIRVLFV